MMRRAGGYMAEDQLDLLYENMHPRYKLYIPRERLYRAGDLLRRTDEIEDLELQCRERQKDTKTPTTAAAVYDRTECCWRCKQRGHTRFTCQRYLDDSAHNAGRMASSHVTATSRRETPPRPGTKRANPGPRHKIFSTSAHQHTNPEPHV